MVWKLQGKCKQCGWCCQQLAALFLKPFHDDNKVRNFYHCRYIERRGLKYICRLREEYDQTGNVTAPKKVRDYFFSQCLVFPSEDEEDHQPPVFDFPDFCGYTWVCVDD
jgi:hypothetical protein